MRTFRGPLLTAAALIGFFPLLAEAQQGRRFENAWFWGVKGGGMVYSTAGVAQNESGQYVALAPRTQQSPTFGAEWLITRTHGGVYVSYDQGFLQEVAGFTTDRFDPEAPVIAVDLSNTRRVNLAGMIFPPVTRWVQPYVGLGLSFLQVAGAEARNPEAFEDAQQEAAFNAFVTQQRTQLQPLGIIGVQARLQPFSVFLQGSATQFDRQFLLRGGRSAVVSYELGIRYNIGSSIERL
jgi:hypothetical protein